MPKAKGRKKDSRKKPKKPKAGFRKAQEESSKGNELALIKEELLGSKLSERYRLMEQIGKGGMGTIYLAEDERLDKKVAVKVLPQEIAGDQETAQRFVQEAKIAPRIEHENSIDVTDLGVTPAGIPFYVMEYLKGKDLGDVLFDEGALPLERITRIALQVCRALKAAHEKKVVHRDMKPYNIFLVEREEKDFVKILDFGLAKLLEKAKEKEGRRLEPDAASTDVEERDPGLTIAGSTLGTPRYMAPEQIRGLEVDNRTDIYAVGVILYEMLCGSVPFDDESSDRLKIFKMHLEEAPVPPSQRQPDLDIPKEFEAIILKALRKDPEDRYQSIEEMETDILRFEEGRRAGADKPPPSVFLDTAGAPQEKHSRSAAAYLEIRKRERSRRIRRWGMIASTVLVLGGGAAVVGKFYRPIAEHIFGDAQTGDNQDE